TPRPPARFCRTLPSLYSRWFQAHSTDRADASRGRVSPEFLAESNTPTGSLLQTAQGRETPSAGVAQTFLPRVVSTDNARPPDNSARAVPESRAPSDTTPARAPHTPCR